MYAAIAVNQSTKPADMVAFSHATLFSPPLTTLAAALRKNFLIGFPGLTKETLAKYPPHSMATIKGHLDQSRVKRKGARSSKRQPLPNPSDPETIIEPNPSDPNEDSETDYNPPSNTPNMRTQYCYAAIIDLTTGQIYTDQTGRFPIPSSKGNNYLFILYEYDSNIIEGEPMKNRQGPSIIAAYKAVFKRLKRAGLSPKLARLDNECSEALKEYLVDEGVDYQLAPPYIHRGNAAERAIRTYKNHFIAGISTCDKDFPLHLWDELVPQANLTLNLLRGSRINPQLSAHAQVYRQFNYTSNPIGPPGTKVLLHEKSTKRGTWAPHASEGWYVGPAIEHYQCFRI
jgi:hypothetical protein